MKWVMAVITSLIGVLIFFLALDSDAQNIEMTPFELSLIKSVPVFSPQIDSSRYHQLLEEYGKNKVFPEEYTWQCLLALSHYPELKETKIDFEVRPAFVPLYSWPRPESVLLPWIDRKFMVVISTRSSPYLDRILFHKLPFNDQVGIIGHELAHTVFYQKKSSFATVVTAFRYQFNRSFQVALERDADRIAVAHGLGYQLYDYAFFVRKAFGRSIGQIKSERGGTYLSPAELAEEMEQFPFYPYPLRSAESYF